MNRGAGESAAAARLALLSLRGSIHASRWLRPNAYALASMSAVVLPADELVPKLVAEPKPLLCRATVREGVVNVSWEAPRTALGRLAWEVAGYRERGGELKDYFVELAAGRPLEELEVLCAAREETLVYSLADVLRWQREYPIVQGGYSFDTARNALCGEWPAYREARGRGVPYILRLGEIPTAAT